MRSFFGKRLITLVALVSILILVMPLVAFADALAFTVNTIVTVGPTQVAPGATGTLSVGLDSNGNGTDTVNGCNATGSNLMTVSLTATNGLGLQTGTVTLAGCGFGPNVTFTVPANAPNGTVYTVTAHRTGGGRPGATTYDGYTSFTVVVVDAVAPILTLPAGMTVEATGAAGAVVSYTATANDAVSGSVAVTCLQASGTTFPLGTTTVNCSASDATTNTATGSFTITVQDTTPPNIGPGPGPIIVEAAGPSGAVVTFSAPAATDLVSGSVAVTCVPASGSTFPVGSTTVDCTATDAAGNTASTSFAITVQDTTAPVLSLPAGITAEATSAAGAPVTYTASAADLVDGSVTVTCSSASGSTFALGSTTVSCSATDAAGNTANGIFTVTVVDTTAPALSLPADITGVEATGAAGAAVTYAAATATDLVDGSVAVICSPASGSTFALGSTTVSCSATDATGNTANGSFNVTVVDTTAPALSLPADIIGVEATSAAGAAVGYTVSATDLVNGSVAVICTPASGSTFALGTTTVNCSATDAAGNTASGSFSVTVVDTTAPVVTITSPTAGLYFTPPAPAVTVLATDAVTANPTTHSLVTDNHDGSFTVTAWAVDGAGNTGYAVPVTYSVWSFGASGLPNRPNVKLGSTLPVRYTLNLPAGADANSLTFRGNITFVEKSSAAPTEGSTENLSTNADTGSTFRYDATANQYIFNLSTKTMKVGKIYAIYVVFNNGHVEKLGEANVTK